MKCIQLDGTVLWAWKFGRYSRIVVISAVVISEVDCTKEQASLKLSGNNLIGCLALSQVIVSFRPNHKCTLSVYAKKPRLNIDCAKLVRSTVQHVRVVHVSCSMHRECDTAYY